MRNLLTSLRMVLVMTLLTGLVYPLLVTAIAQLTMAGPANGSLVSVGGKTVGSRLVGQAWSSPGYFWGRPSATAPFPYNAAASVGSNLGPTNPALLERVGKDVARLREADPGARGPVPADLVTASASGLDPQMSPASAYFQVERVARARGADPAAVRRLVDAHVEGRQLGFLGEPRVNVLLLNLALDEAFPAR